MKKLSMIAAMVLCLALVMTGCSGNDKDGSKETQTTEAGSAGTESGSEAGTDGSEAGTEGSTEAETYVASDYVKLGQYKDLEVAAADVEVTEDELNTQIAENISTAYVDVTDRPVAEGDTVNIDYEGLKDGVAFEGGTAAGQNLTIGSGQFIEGFEDGLIGANVGDKLELNLSFPETYSNNPDLAGQAVVFNVTVNSIKVQATELTDEVAKQNFNFDTADAYRESVKQELIDGKKWKAAWTMVVNNATINGYPSAKDTYVNGEKETLTAYASQYGMALSDILTAVYNMSEEEFDVLLEENFRDEMLMLAITEAENMEVSDQAYTDRIKEISEINNNASQEEIEAYFGADYLRKTILQGMVYDIVMDSVVVK